MSNVALNIFGTKDAFALMWYECKKCKKREQIWNSRSRVTPFGTNCAVENCSGLMSHVDWHLDSFEPMHELKVGDRFFADFSKEAHEKEYRKVVDENWDTGRYPINILADTKEEALQMFMNEWEFGTPCTLVFEGHKHQGISEPTTVSEVATSEPE
jgi:hypothetical protein